MIPTDDPVMAHIAELARALRAAGPPASADRDDAVHQLRTVTRRLRTVLETFPFARPRERRRAARLVERLQRLGGVLGAARDLEVQRARARELGERRLARRLGRRHRRALERVRRELRRERHRKLLRRLDRFARHAACATRDEDGLRALIVHRAQAVDSVRSADTLEALHALRKRARALRHVADAVAGLRDAPELAAAARELQQLLGTHRDDTLLAGQVDADAAREVLLASAATALAAVPGALVRVRAAAARFARPSTIAG